MTVDIALSIGRVLESSPALVRVEMTDPKSFEENKERLAIGQYLLIATGNTSWLIGSITALRASYHEDKDPSEEMRFVIDVQPVGTWSEDVGFCRGAQALPVPTEPAHLLPSTVLKTVFGSTAGTAFTLGRLKVSDEVSVTADGNRLFSKHIAVVGSTGAGKSCAVATILQNAVGIKNGENINKAAQKNAHIVIFDIHSEYKAAFELEEHQKFSLNNLDVRTILLPYWLLNSDELEALFIESNESNSYNQISQFRNAVVENKKKHNTKLKEVSFDTPVYFSIKEVITYLENLNREVIGKLEGEGVPKLSDGSLIVDRSERYFSEELSFVPTSNAKDTKASNGPFAGEFDRLIMRLRTKVSDPRLKFLLSPSLASGQPLKTSDFSDVVQQFIGYITRSNISIIDLSGIPFEVLSIVVSLISRIIFDFGFHYSKLRHASGEVSNVPIMLVCEEAHAYVPRHGGAEYAASRKSIERIAKEGRKYGVTLMVVSQRPSEVTETIFSQCSNFIALRLTNQMDQSYIKSLLPEISAGLSEILPSLGQGEFLAVGDAFLIPSVGVLALPRPEPHSKSVPYLQEWQADWKHVDFDTVIARWRGDV